MSLKSTVTKESLFDKKIPMFYKSSGFFVAGICYITQLASMDQISSKRSEEIKG